MPPCSVRPGDTGRRDDAARDRRARRPASRGRRRPRWRRPRPRTVRARGSTWTPRIRDRSTTRPPSLMALPATLWPPPLTERSRSCSRAKLTASTTSAAPRALDDQRRPAVDQPVLDRAGLVVARVAGREDRPANARVRTPPASPGRALPESLPLVPPRAAKRRKSLNRRRIRPPGF